MFQLVSHGKKEIIIIIIKPKFMVNYSSSLYIRLIAEDDKRRISLMYRLKYQLTSWGDLLSQLSAALNETGHNINGSL